MTAQSNTRQARLSVNISDATISDIEALEPRHPSTTEMVRRAIGVYRFVDDESVAGSHFLLRRRASDSAQEVRFEVD